MESNNMNAYDDALRIAELSVTGELKLSNKIHGNSLPGDYDTTLSDLGYLAADLSVFRGGVAGHVSFYLGEKVSGVSLFGDSEDISDRPLRRIVEDLANGIEIFLRKKQPPNRKGRSAVLKYRRASRMSLNWWDRNNWQIYHTMGAKSVSKQQVDGRQEDD
jgi:hypothetical protein